MDHHPSSDEDDCHLPVASAPRQRGWAGEEFEMNHTREQFRQGITSEFTAVDIKQFHNTIVGVGYQAKGVIRQKAGVIDEPTTVKDMRTKPKEEPRKRSKRERKHPGEGKVQRLQRYLQCAGIREFRRQIEEILSSDGAVQRR
jgi:hypothetical protein